LVGGRLGCTGVQLGAVLNPIPGVTGDCTWLGPEAVVLLHAVRIGVGRVVHDLAVFAPGMTPRPPGGNGDCRGAQNEQEGNQCHNHIPLHFSPP
jgi:hypothetical protein